MPHMKNIVGILLLLTLVVPFLSLFSCTQCTNLYDKPAIVWTNYDLDEGLGAPAYSPAKGFEPLPIVDGILCNDIGLSNPDGTATLWVGTNGPLMCSKDLGSSWQIIEESLVSFQGPGLIRIDGSGGIWIATRCGVHHSTDGGVSWSDVYHHPMWCSGINDMEIAGDMLWVAASEVCQVVRVDIPTASSVVTYTGTEWIEEILPASDGSLYISTASGIFKSPPLDGGTAFDHFYGSGVHKNLLEVDGTFWCTDLAGNVKQLSAAGELLWESLLGIRVLKPAPADGVLWGINSDENGAVLARIDTRNANAVDITELGVDTTRALYIDGEGTIYLSLPGEIAYSSDGGGTWTHRIVGISTIELIAAKGEAAWAGVSGIGASRFLPAENQWETVSGRFPGYLDGIYLRSPSEAFLSLGYGPVVGRTTDGGDTFVVSYYDVSPEVAERSYGCRSICEDSSGRLYLCSSAWSWDHLHYWINVYSSDTDGATWSPPESVYHGSAFPRWPEMAIDETRRILWVTSGVGLFRRGLDGGSWQTEEGFGYTESPLVDVSGIVYIVGEGSDGWGLYLLENGRTDWEYRGLPDSNTYDTSLVVDLDGDLWFASNTGVHYSSDAGSSWATYTKEDGLASTYVNSISIDGSGDSRVLWAGTVLGASRGVIVAP
jgi:hypothetical protein